MQCTVFLTRIKATIGVTEILANAVYGSFRLSIQTVSDSHGFSPSKSARLRLASRDDLARCEAAARNLREMQRVCSEEQICILIQGDVGDDKAECQEAIGTKEIVDQLV